jgi:MFS family permease
VHAERRVFALLLNTALLSCLASPFLVLLPVFARDVLRVGADGLGLMGAAVGLGAVGAALGLAALAPQVHRGRLLAWTGRLFGLSVAAFGLARWYPAALAVLGVAGFSMILNNAVTNTMLQGIVPDELRGRVMSLWSLVFVGFAPIGALGSGWLAGRVGPNAPVVIGGLLSAAASWWIWRRLAPETVALR